MDVVPSLLVPQVLTLEVLELALYSVPQILPTSSAFFSICLCIFKQFGMSQNPRRKPLLWLLYRGLLTSSHFKSGFNTDSSVSSVSGKIRPLVCCDHYPILL